jgi:hypothetical protein
VREDRKTEAKQGDGGGSKHAGSVSGAVDGDNENLAQAKE